MLTFKKKLLISIGICALSTMSFMISWPMQFVVTGSLYALAGYILTVSDGQTDLRVRNAFILCTPYLLVYGVGAVWIGNPITYPIWLIAIFNTIIGILIGYRWHRTKSGIAALVFVLLVTATGYVGMKNWISFVRNPSPHVSEIPPEVIFSDEQGKPLALKDLRGKTIVLDFWSTTCAPCVRKFPELEAISKKFRQDTNIVVASVYLPTPGDTPEKIKNFGSIQHYSFTRLYSRENRTWQQFNVPFLPYLVVIDKEHRIRYRGSFHTEWNYFIINANRVIDRINKM